MYFHVYIAMGCEEITLVHPPTPSNNICQPLFNDVSMHVSTGANNQFIIGRLAPMIRVQNN